MSNSLESELFWKRIMSVECRTFMNTLTGEEEDKNMIDHFFKHVRERIKDHKVVIMLAINWHTYDSMKQAHFALHYAGMFHASRFIMFMDFLSKKFLKGELR